MSSGQFTIVAPHICGAAINVTVKWYSSPGTYFDPPEYDEQWEYSFGHFDEPCVDERCPKCGVDLGWDDIFQLTVNELKKTTDPGEYDDGPEYDPLEEEEMKDHKDGMPF